MGKLYDFSLQLPDTLDVTKWQGSRRAGAYILKVKKSADSTFQSKKICGKSAQIATTTKVRISIKSLRNASF